MIFGYTMILVFVLISDILQTLDRVLQKYLINEITFISINSSFYNIKCVDKNDVNKVTLSYLLNICYFHLHKCSVNIRNDKQNHYYIVICLVLVFHAAE